MHDELIVEVRGENLNQVYKIMKEEMEFNYFHLNVKLPVKFKLGQNWGDLKDFNCKTSTF